MRFKNVQWFWLETICQIFLFQYDNHIKSNFHKVYAKKVFRKGLELLFEQKFNFKRLILSELMEITSLVFFL